jgi:hypothetical protein
MVLFPMAKSRPFMIFATGEVLRYLSAFGIQFVRFGNKISTGFERLKYTAFRSFGLYFLNEYSM